MNGLTRGSDHAVTVASRRDALVSIVIVTYGTDEVVLEALYRVACQTTVPYDVIVVDNLPDDERAPTRDLLRRRTRGVRLIAVDENLGFAGANDLAVEHSTAEYVCLLNPDAFVAGDWLAPLMRALDDPQVGVAAPLLLNPDGTVQEAGQLILGDGWTAALGGPTLLPGDESQLFSRDVDYASGCCWLVRRAEHIARGGFDRRYHPAYFEDTDYAMRLRRDGKVIRLVVDQPVVHRWGQGGGGRDGTMSHRTHDLFVELWGEQLAGRPTWPDGRAGVIAMRDHMCARRFACVAGAGLPVDDRRRLLAQAVELATRRPRDRVTFVTDDADGLDVVGARRAGVEVVAGDVDAIVAERQGLVTDWGLDSFDSDAALTS